MVEVKVCIGTSCHLHGSYNVMMSFKQLIEEYNLHDKINLAGRFCTGCCQNGVSVTVNDTEYGVSPETAGSFFRETILPLASEINNQPNFTHKGRGSLPRPFPISIYLIAALC